MEKVKEWWNKYWDWLFELPDGLGFFLAVISIIVPIFITCSILWNVSRARQRLDCLDSEIARRWNNWICEEYQDNTWIEVDLSRDSIYYYNDAGSKK